MHAEQAHGGSHGELEKVARAEECGWAGNAMYDAEPAVEQMGQARVELHLDQDRHGQQHDGDRLLEDLPALERACTA